MNNSPNLQFNSVKTWSILNCASVILAILVTYYSQLYGINGKTIGEMSRQYENLFTPAGYAFAIWGLIYLGLVVLSITQVYQAFGPQKHLAFIAQGKYWFMAANVFNAAWVLTWLSDFTGVSVIMMLCLLWSLVQLILKTDMERWDAPLVVLSCYWWPVCLYSGWISVALIANAAAFLVKIGWEPYPFSAQAWTLVMISVATILHVAMIYFRNMREFAAVGIWALLAIYVRHADAYETIAFTALGGAILVGLYALYHGYQNRKTNPMFKLFQALSK